MKKFKITVNGKAYDVEVEEIGTTPASPAASQSVVAPQAAPAPAPAPTAQPASASAPAGAGPIPAGAVVVKAPMPGKISSLKAEAGQAIKRGDVILVLEAMKMQNDITSTTNGTLHEIRVNPGENVKTGDILAVITK